MAANLEQFIAGLSASGLLTPEELGAFRGALPADKQPKDVQQFASELVRQGKLTKFQASEIYNGRGKGLVLGDYVILEKIGAGGMGQVFKAQHKRMKRLVAIKLLPAATTRDPQAIKRFQREVEAAARLTHPNIVAALDAREERGLHYLVMEYVEGSDLSGIVKKHGAMAVKQAVDCILQAARGLEHAHAEGIVHRDIKPANLLVDKKGTVKVLDMGLARIENPLAGGDDGLTNTGNIMGTVDFMSPEQAEDTKHADARADIYSLGCTLYYLLTAKKMFEGDTVMKKLLAHREAPVPSLLARQSSPHAPREESESANSRVSPFDDKGRPTLGAASANVSRSETATMAHLDAVFRRMVAKRPQDRYQTITEVISALESAQSGQSDVPGETVQLSPDPATDDPGLASFLRNLGTAAVATAQQQAPSITVPEETLARLADGQTSPLQISPLGRSREPSGIRSEHRHGAKSASSPRSGSTPRTYWTRLRTSRGMQAIAAGCAAGMVLLCFGIWVIVKDQHGNEIAKVKVPAGGSVEIETTPAPANNSIINRPTVKPAPAAAKEWTYDAWEPLFDGQTISDWHGDLAVMSVENGVLVNNGQRGVPVAPGDYPNFEFEMEFRLADGGNSGVGIHYSGQGDPSQSGLEIQLLDDAGWPTVAPDQRCGSVYKLVAANPGHFKRWLQWNTLTIRSLGPELEVVLNGISVTKATRPVLLRANPNHLGLTRTSGAICLYPHTARSEYRNLRVRRASWGASRAAGTGAANDLPKTAIAPFTAAEAKAHQEAWAKHLGTKVETTNSVGMKMILIPPGEFLMGSSDEQVQAALKVAEDQGTKDRIQKAERPQHRVVIRKPFLMGATGVTIGQFKKFAAASSYQTEAEKAEIAAKAAPRQSPAAGDPPPPARKPIQTYLSPGYPVIDDSPAAVVTWNDALAYCTWLSQQENKTYRLPTEAEWEYACRAGTTTQYSFGDDANLLDRFGWYNKNSGEKSQPVGTKLPNAFGLHDMHGNLWEWCEDYWDEKWYEKSSLNDPNGPVAGSNRVLRGGYWGSNASNCRCACRNLNTPSNRNPNHGFRCVRAW